MGANYSATNFSRNLLLEAIHSGYPVHWKDLRLLGVFFQVVEGIRRVSRSSYYTVADVSPQRLILNKVNSIWLED